MYTVASVGVVPVSIVKLAVAFVPLKYCKIAPLAFLGVKLTLGATPKALAKVIVAKVPVAAQPEPVVMLIVPLVSLPVTATVGVVQAAAPAVMVGLEPAVIIWPFIVRLPVSSRLVTVTLELVVSTVNIGVVSCFWICRAVVESSWTLVLPFDVRPVKVPRPDALILARVVPAKLCHCCRLVVWVELAFTSSWTLSVEPLIVWLAVKILALARVAVLCQVATVESQVLSTLPVVDVWPLVTSQLAPSLRNVIWPLPVRVTSDAMPSMVWAAVLAIVTGPNCGTPLLIRVILFAPTPLLATYNAEPSGVIARP